MLNKKILAVAVASAFSMNAFATVDLTAADQDIQFASETYVATDLNAGGLLPVADTNTAGALDVSTILGFSIGEGTSKYVRINLTNAEFGDALTIGDVTVTTAGTGVAGVSLSQGGGDGDDFAIFEIAATDATAGVDDIEASDTVAFDISDLDISVTATSSVSVTTYDTASDAVNQTNPLFTDSSDYTTVLAATSGTFTVDNTVTATVVSGFTAYEVSASPVVSATDATLGEVDVDLWIKAGTFYDAATNVVVATDLVTGTQDLEFAGDFSFGTFAIDTDGDCGDGANRTALTLNTDENEGTVAAVNIAAGDVALCSVLNGTTDVALKGSYTVTLGTDNVTGDIGEVKYNTTSIEVPYLTTFSSYNQRLYIINNGSRDALYTTSFTSEAGVTVTAGAKATGTVPAGEMVAIKATDMVTLVGKTRTSAIIEIEATDADVSAATQSVNLSTGGTDTVVLN